jgi:hypothetical protein
VTTPLTAAQHRLRDLRQQARRLSQLLAGAEQSEAGADALLSPLAQAKLLIRLDRLAGKLEVLAEQTADAVADAPQRR